MQHINTILRVTGVWLTAAPSLATCPTTQCMDDSWTPDCQNPTIVVNGDVTCVVFSDNNVTITATSGQSTPGESFITIGAASSGTDLGDVVITSIASIDVVLTLDDSIDDVGSVQMDDSVSNEMDNLYILGEIDGDLGGVYATALGVSPNAFGFEIGRVARH